MSRILARFLLAGSTGIAQPVQSARSNQNCDWPTNLNQPAQHGRLARDAEFAEDLAIRYRCLLRSSFRPFLKHG